MTDREAIDVLFNEWKCIDRNDGIHCDRKCESCDLVMDVGIIREAFNMAISALQAQDVHDTNVGDMVSRQKTIDALCKRCDLVNDDTCGEKCIDIKILEKLPSAQPEIIRCKDCEYGEQDDIGRWFCNDLGCQMGSEDGSGYCANAEMRTDG